MRLVFANEATAARRRVYFHLTDATDGITAETGEAAGQPQVSSDGAAFTNTGIGTLSHLGNGRYSADLTQTLVATAGVSIETRYKSAATAETPGDSVQVVAFNPYSTSLDILLAAANLSADTITAVKIATGAITAAKFAAGAIDAAAIATDAIDADAIADNAINAGAIATGAITAAKFAAGAIDAAAIATDAITAAKIAADAIGASELAADAVTEIQSGLATSAALATVQADTDDIQARLPAALVSGRMDSSVGAMAAGVVTAAAVATGAIDADALAADAGTEIAAAVDTTLTAAHGAGTWGGGGSAAIVTGTADSGSTTTMVDAARTEADTDYWKGDLIHFTSGTIAGQVRLITGFNAATDTITFTPATTQAVGTNTYQILASAGVDVRLWMGSSPDVLSSGRVDTRVVAMDVGVITSTAIATDAIGSSELASSAIDEIVDQVWNELLSGHAVAGSTGEALSNAGSGASAATIADAVWDEARAGHVAGGSFGEGVASVQGNVTGSVASVTGNVGGNVTGSVGSIAAGGIAAASFAAGAIDSAAIATDAIGSAELAASAVTEIQSGLATSAAQTTAQTDLDDIQTRLPAALVSGRMDSSVGAMAADVVTASAIATDAIGSAELAASAVNKIADQVWEEAIADHSGTVGSTAEALDAAASGGSAPSAAVIADAVWDELLADHVTAATMGANQNLIDNINSDTDDIQTRLPAALVGGRIDSSVGAMAADVLTAAAIATDAFDSDAVASSAVTEIQAGLATSAALATAQADLDDIQLRLPAPLTTGTADSGTTSTMVDAARTESAADYWKGSWIRFTSGTISGQTRFISAFDTATDTITFAPNTTAAVSTNTYEILPAASTLIGSYSIENDAITDQKITLSAAQKISDAVWDELIAGHLGAGSTGEALSNAAAGGSPGAIADAVWDEARAGHVAAGSFGEGVASVQGNVTGSVASVTGNVGGNVTGSVGSVAAGGIAAASFAAGAIDAAAIATDAIGSAELAASAVTEIQSGLATAAALATVQADTDDIQARLPAALVGGRMDSSVGAMAANVITAAATDASFIAEINAEVDTALADLRLDEVIVNAASPATPTIDSFWDRITSKDGGQTYDRTSDSLEAHQDTTSARLPVALIGGRMDSSVGAMAANVITATAIATGAIDADALATDAVNEIVDQVWDELIAGHLGAGSTGEALNNAAAGGSPAAIADAVWDELRAGHVGAGSFGEGVASVQGNVTGSVASVTGNVGGNVVGSVGSVAAGGITAASIATDAIDADALAASALAEINTEIDTALADIRLDELIQNAAAPATPTVNSFIDRMTSKDGTQTYDRSTDSLEGIRDALAAAGPSAATIADAVWDEALADHVAVGSMGFNENLIDDVFADTNDIQARLPAALVGGRMDSSVGAMAAGVVTAAAVATGAIDADALATDAVNEIVDQVWEEQLGDHSGTVGSTAEALDSAASGGSAPSAAVIADAVWDEALAGHVLAGSTGEAQNMIDDILTDTAAIQPLVDVAVSTRATPAQVNTEVDTALADIRLDELIQNVAAPITPTIDSFIDRITSKNGAQTYDRSTDSLEAASDAIVAAGPSAAIIADAVWDEVLAGHLTAGSTGAALDAIGDDLDLLMGPGFNPLTDSLEEIRDEVDACCGVGGGGDEVDVEAG